MHAVIHRYHDVLPPSLSSLNRPESGHSRSMWILPVFFSSELFCMADPGSGNEDGRKDATKTPNRPGIGEETRFRSGAGYGTQTKIADFEAHQPERSHIDQLLRGSSATDSRQVPPHGATRNAA
jgi:hypothetical protein